MRLNGLWYFSQGELQLGERREAYACRIGHKGSPGREVAVRLRDLLPFRFYRSASPGLVRLFAIHVKL